MQLFCSAWRGYSIYHMMCHVGQSVCRLSVTYMTCVVSKPLKHRGSYAIFTETKLSASRFCEALRRLRLTTKFEIFPSNVFSCRPVASGGWGAMAPYQTFWPPLIDCEFTNSVPVRKLYRPIRPNIMNL